LITEIETRKDRILHFMLRGYITSVCSHVSDNDDNAYRMRTTETGNSTLRDVFCRRCWFIELQKEGRG